MNLNNKKSIDIQLNIEAEETIKKLEKIKQLLQDIIELDETMYNKNINIIDIKMEVYQHVQK